MAFIIQGSNEPIVLTLSEIDISKAEALSAVLSAKGKIYKHWSLSDITIAGGEVTFPLTEHETMQLNDGVVRLEVKFVIDGDIEFLDAIHLEVLGRDDRTEITT